MWNGSSASLEHLRVFAIVVDEGSFSGAARVLNRSQPAVSYAIGVLESQLGVTLFERGRRRPVLTDAGAVMLAYARRMRLLDDELQATAANLTLGLEGAVSLAIDSFFPVGWVQVAMKEFAQRYPSVAVNLTIESRDAVVQRVLDGQCVFGVAATDVAWPAGIEARDFGEVQIIAVAAPDHVLAVHAGEIPASQIRDSLQITNKLPGLDGEARDVAINSARLWRVSDLATAVALLKVGVGWGYLPLHVAQAEIDAGGLARLSLSTRSFGAQPFSLLYRADSPPGPGARWLAERLIEGAG
jgi:DNA-binding transcriptional LysR family regulator